MAIKDTHSYTYDYRSRSSANIDANYGPWTSIDGDEETSYKSWRTLYEINTIKEGTQIAIKPNSSSEVTLKIYSKGVWKDVGSGKVDYTEAESGDYAPLANYVSYTDQGVLDENKKQAARNNIGAVSSTQVANAISNKVDKSDWLFTYNGTQVGYHGGINSDGGGSGGGSPVMPDGALSPTSSNPVQNQVITEALGSKLSKDYGNGDAELVRSNVTFESETGTSTETVIANTFKFTKSNTGATGVTAGFLTRNTTGVVSSQALTAMDVEYTAGEGYPTTILTSGNTVDWCLSALDDAITESNERIDGIEVTTPGTLDTNNSSAQTVNSEESLGGTVKLHKVSKTGAYADLIGKPNVSTSNNTTTISGDAYVSGGTVLGSSTNPSTPKNVTINNGTNGSTTVNGTLTVTGDVNLGTGNASAAKTITIGSSGTNNPADDVVVNGNVTISNNLTLADIAGANGGVLRVDSNGAVYADPSSYITGSIMVDTYDDLPTSGIEPGEVRFIRDTGKISTALQVVADTKLYVSIPNVYVTEANANKRVLEAMCTEERPLVQYSTFLNNFSEIVDEHNAEDVYGDYPAIPYREHKLTESAGDDLYVIPVQHTTYGKIMIAISKVSGKAWIVPTSSVGAINTWYVDEVGSTGGLSTGSLIEITDNYDSLPSDLTNVREFMTFGGGVIWSK